MKTFASYILSFFCSTTVFAQDWGQLKYFEKENKLLIAEGKVENRVVFIGNSITEGWSNAFPDFFSKNAYINRGISSQTTPQMLLRFRADVIDLQPRVVVILAGTNDIAQNTGPITLKQIMDNIKSMAELADANGINVVLSSVLPAFDYPWRRGLSPNTKIPALNALLKTYAVEKGFVYLDYFKAMNDGNNGLQSGYTYDGVHPNTSGYEVMMPLAQEAIAIALK